MSQVTEGTNAVVSPEEVARRIAEYRRMAFERQLAAQVVYHGDQVPCPWPDCGLRIRGINFQLDKMAGPDPKKRWLAVWWQGPGLVGRCPQCGHYVRFDVEGKQAVANPEQETVPLLPEGWHEHAHLVVRPD